MASSLYLSLLICLVTTGILLLIGHAFHEEFRVLFLLLVSVASLQGFCCGFLARHCRASKEAPESKPEQYTLHWNPRKERRGIGDLVKCLNHVALIVSDVGRSLAFYVEVLGFQQIQRPNFDRHGAWLTMGNTELHLIKGIPVVPSGEDLIVSHMALETEHPQLILEKLIEMNIPFRQNISVPDPKRARDNLVEDFKDSVGKVTQYFVRDPDGYYYEICNCDILTKFCLEKEAEGFKNEKAHRSLVDAFLCNYMEVGNAPSSVFRCPMLFKIGCVVKMAVRRARVNIVRGCDAHLQDVLKGVVAADHADETLLSRFQARQKTYSDVTQGFTKKDLTSALQRAGNHAPVAILILKSMRQHETVMLPPVYLVNNGGDENHEGQLVKQHVKKARARTSIFDKLGTSRMFMGKGFEDNHSHRQAYSADADHSRISVWQMFDKFGGQGKSSSRASSSLPSDHWEETQYRVGQKRQSRVSRQSTVSADQPRVSLPTLLGEVVLCSDHDSDQSKDVQV